MKSKSTLSRKKNNKTEDGNVYYNGVQMPSEFPYYFACLVDLSFLLLMKETSV